MNPAAKADVAEKSGSQDEGVAISIIVSEVEAVGGFIGSSFSEPILNGGILLSIFGYMLFTQPLLALVAIALFCPQFLFIPCCRAINSAPGRIRPCATSSDRHEAPSAPRARGRPSPAGYARSTA